MLVPNGIKMSKKGVIKRVNSVVFVVRTFSSHLTKKKEKYIIGKSYNLHKVLIRIG